MIRFEVLQNQLKCPSVLKHRKDFATLICGLRNNSRKKLEYSLRWWTSREGKTVLVPWLFWMDCSQLYRGHFQFVCRKTLWVQRTIQVMIEAHQIKSNYYGLLSPSTDPTLIQCTVYSNQTHRATKRCHPAQSHLAQTQPITLTPTRSRCAISLRQPSQHLKHKYV